MQWARTSVVAFEFIKLLESERVRFLVDVLGEDIASAPGFATGVAEADDATTVMAAALKQERAETRSSRRYGATSE